MEKRVRLKTCPVLGNRLANTVDAIRAALVDKLAGILLFLAVPFKEDDESGAGVP